jgi:(2Fe-2S) ferredoxin
MPPSSMNLTVEQKYQELGIPGMEYHLFLCADQTKPKCCDKDLGLAVWEYLKGRLIELNLEKRVGRTKANCLRLCMDGPILVIYPQGIWYKNVTIEVLERILQEHIFGGKIVEEFVIRG